MQLDADVRLGNDEDLGLVTSLQALAERPAEREHLPDRDQQDRPQADGAECRADAEGDAATADSTSTLAMVDQTFKTYSSQAVLVSQEMLDDAGFDVAAEVTSLGMAKSTGAFDADAVAAVLRDRTPTD